MKRNLGLALIAVFVIGLTFLLPTSLAKRDDNSVKRSNPGGQLTPEMFKLNRQDANGPAPIARRAVNFAESIPVRDMAPAEPKALGKGSGRGFFEKGDSDVGKFGVPEKNKRNRETMRRNDPNAPSSPDQALSSKGPRANAPSPNPPNPPSVNFEGQSIADTIAVGQGFLPPDTNGDVGPAHYVQTVNVTFRIWDKAGNPLTPVASLNTLFGPLGPPCGSSEDGDPIVVYDQLADRWLISQFCTPANPEPSTDCHLQNWRPNRRILSLRFHDAEQ